MVSKILIVDDEKEMCWAISKNLKRKGYEVAEAYSGEDALDMVEKENFCLAILDFKMTGIDGLETLSKIKQISPETRVIFMTAYGDDELAMKSLERGADDFLHKPFDMKNLAFRVTKTLEYHTMETEVQTIRVRDKSGLSSIIAECDRMKAVVKQIGRVAGADAPVMVYGETGTGKEVVARSIHYNDNNPRSTRPFISVNSAAIPEALIESELFGHSKGAFTGAGSVRHGLFEAADGGTLFLDEISSAPLQLQAKLLRILDSGEFMRVGESRTRKVDVRVITATNRDLNEDVKSGDFREDLYHRLNVLKINIPPLRERGGDIGLLIGHFSEYYGKKAGRRISFDNQAMAVLNSYTWPGNVRELKHCIERLALMSDEDVITVDSLPSRMIGGSGETEDMNESFADLKANVVKNFEIKFFTDLIRQTDGNVSKAARNADMNRAYLIKKLKEYDIETGKEK